jgi:hypothetical protein
VWDEFLHMELTHLQLWGDMLRHCEGVDPEVLFGEELTVEFKFQENKEYVRQVLAQQRDLRVQPYGYTTLDQVPEATRQYQAIVHADGIPSEDIVDRQALQPKELARPGDELLMRARELAVQTRDASSSPVKATTKAMAKAKA